MTVVVVAICGIAARQIASVFGQGTGETYKTVVKVTFFKGAALPDPSGLFNSSLEGNTRRAIDFQEGELVDEKAFKALVRAAVTLNKRKG